VTGRMLIAGVGNIFLSDDGFGVEVASRLATADLPDWVRVADYGISGMHLAYDLAEGYESTILVDATPRGGEPGTVYVMELDTGVPSAAAAATAPAAPAAPGAPAPPGAPATPGAPAAGSGVPLLDAHGMQPDVVLGMLNLLGAEPGRVFLVGCEPASTDEGIGLSEPVTAAVDEAVRVVLDLVRTADTITQSTAKG
jgi:hydrogenase maturation protease